jgi:hypothetical protein
MEETTNQTPSDLEHRHPCDEQGSTSEKSEIPRAFDQIRALKARVEEPLYDEQGLIPDYPPRRCDEKGRPLPFTPEEISLRSEIFRRAMAVINANDQDPPGSDEEFMRGIDSHRPEGSKLFEGYY